MRKNKGKSTKSSRKECKTENPYLWLEDFEQQVCNNGDWKWEHGVFGEGEDEQSQKFEGKTEKDLKTAIISVKHAFFATWLSRHTVASSSRQSTQEQKIWKIFLSIFHDWKVYPRVSRELSRENLLVNLATWPSTREQVAKNDQRRCDWGSRLETPATEPPKTGQNWIFGIFRFFKQNTFQKHLKHSKIFLCLN